MKKRNTSKITMKGVTASGNKSDGIRIDHPNIEVDMEDVHTSDNVGKGINVISSISRNKKKLIFLAKPALWIAGSLLVAYLTYFFGWS